MGSSRLTGTVETLGKRLRTNGILSDVNTKLSKFDLGRPKASSDLRHSIVWTLILTVRTFSKHVSPDSSTSSSFVDFVVVERSSGTRDCEPCKAELGME